MPHTAALSDLNVLEPSLPAAWHRLRVLLAEFDRFVSGKPPLEPAEARAQTLAEAAALRARLLEETARVAELSPDAHPIAPERHQAWFIDAVLMWTRFAAAGGRARVDTLGDDTLGAFPIDFEPTDGDRARLFRALSRVSGQDEAAIAARAENLGHLSSNLLVKRAITDWVSDSVNTADDPDAAVLALFHRLYGPVPLRVGDVSLVCTSAVMFFCIPIGEDDVLAQGDFAARPEAERQHIQRFLGQAQRASMSSKQVRFPAFGLFERERIDPTLAADIAAAAHPELVRAFGDEGRALTPEVVVETLATMLILVPADKAPMFLVHDAWGHAWQETLCEFEWLFGGFGALDSPLTPDTGGVAEADGTPTLRHAFTERDGRAALDHQALEHAVEADLRRRIKVGLNLAASEALADLIEHKFARVFGPEHALPTSSLLPDATCKLDLGLLDVKRAVRLWRKPYVRLSSDAEVQAALVDALAERGAVRAGLDEAVAEAASHILRRYAHAFSLEVGAAEGREGGGEQAVVFGPTDEIDQAGDNNARGQAAAAVAPRAGDDGDGDGEARTPTTVLERGMLSTLALDAALTPLLESGQARYRARCEAAGRELPRWLCPSACIDLIALMLGWYYDQDHAVVLWHLDELLIEEIWPSLLALEDALANEA
ncbi:hypothetical protein [Haliangium ochraceum]|uniref:Uncharacterized protein n=1 Tax=Haliangium ochraceum (strain DSM 14365 / JCM 11303 / SMP-2) TaxID=502025 RepID=D0LVK8_HALO1|nr:hypothetical protein [Haliangium ochraceum]ACY17569.1 conserved hypothetical protein [Haliangium ochraceum DSM 14365]